MNRATLIELPPALCINNAPSLVALVARDESTMAVAQLYVGKNFDFTGSPAASFTLLQVLTRFAWHGTLAADYSGDSLTIDLERGTTIQLDGPDLILDEVTPFDALANTVLIFIGGEILSLAGATLTAAGQYKIFTVRGRFGTARQSHASGSEVFIMRADELAPINLPSHKPGGTGQFKLVRGVDNLSDQNSADVDFHGLTWQLPPPAMVVVNGQDAGRPLIPAATLDISWVLPDAGAALPRFEFVKPHTLLQFIFGGAVVYQTEVAWPATTVSIDWTTITGEAQQTFWLLATTRVDAGDAVISGWNSISGIAALSVVLPGLTDDSLAIYVNGIAIRDLGNANGTDPFTFDLMALALSAGVSINIGDVISFKARDNFGGDWTTQPWTATVTFFDGSQQIVNGGAYATGPSVAGTYYDDGEFTIQKP